MDVYDCIVIGGGVNGSSTAYSLSKQEKKTLLLEQFPVPHTRGSSHGQSRIIRCLYPELIYGQMTYDAMSIWRTLEKETGKELFLNNGMLEIYEGESEKLQQCLDVLKSVGVPYEKLTAEEVNRRFPVFNVPSTFAALYEETGGTLMASKCVHALQEQFVKNGGIFHDGETVMKIIPGHNMITINTDKKSYKTKSLVITAGSYTKELTKQLGLDLPLRVERTFACYWKLANPSSGSLSNGFPSFICKCKTNNVYGLAAHEYPGLIKVCEHAGRVVDINYPDAEPDMSNTTTFVQRYTKGVEDTPTIVERCLYTVCKHGGRVVDINYPDVEPDISNTTSFIQRYTKGVEDTPTIVERCLLTITPDHNFILDTHPVYKNIAIGAGFSGSGFKMAPVTGEILAELAMGKQTKYDLSLLRLNRFTNVISSKL